MQVKHKAKRINLDNIAEYNDISTEFDATIELCWAGCDNKSFLCFESAEMAQRSMLMIDRHRSRGRSSCNLDLLEKYDKKGNIVLLTELIRRTINRIAGRLGL